MASMYENKTREDYNLYLNSLTYLNVLSKLLPRIIGENPNYYFDMNGADQYERLKMQNKPTRQQFEDEFIVWIEEEKLRIKVIFDDLDEELALRTKVATLDHPDIIIRHILNIDVPNVKLYLNTLVNNRDASQINLISSKNEEANQFFDMMKGKSKRKEIGLLSRKICDAALAILGGWTVQLEMTEEQVDGLETMFSEVRDALIIGRAIKAHGLIKTMDLTGSLLTEQMRKEMLEEFSPLGLV